MKFRVTDNPSRRGDVFKRGDQWFLWPDKPITVPPVDDSDRGPPGEQGLAGRDGIGRDGRDGVDGNGFNFRGPWKRQTSYVANDVVTHEGQTFVCAMPTSFAEPGVRKKNWTLWAAKGVDGEKLVESYHTRVVRHAESVSRVQIGFTESVALGDVVRIAGDNVAAKALAHGSDANALAVGLVSGVGEMQTSGPLVCETWNLTPGTVYYLSPTVPGALTDVYPDTLGDYVVIVGSAVTPTQLNISIHWAAIIGS